MHRHSSPPTGMLQRKCACGNHASGGECAACREKREKPLQRAAVTSELISAVPPIVNDVLRSPGQPLDAGMRTFFEQKFGHDFSGVPVQAGAFWQTMPVGLAQELTLPSGPGYVPFPQTPSDSGTCKVGHSTSNCFPDAGGYIVGPIENDCCTKPCTLEHEVQHVRDFDACCKAYSQALKKPGANRLTLTQTWLSWKEQARPVSECRAYMNDVTCAQRLAQLKGCAPTVDERNRLAASESSEQEESEVLSEETAQGAPPAKTHAGIVNELAACCIDIAWYEQAFAAEAAKWCGYAGGKPIPPCPFIAKPRKP